MTITPEQMAEWERLAERAHQEVGEVCKEGAAQRWRMSIPAQPDRDSDLIISDALAAVPLLAAALREAHAQAVASEQGRQRAEAERDAARAEAERLREERDNAWTVVREGTANMRAQLATVRDERDDARTKAGQLLDRLAAAEADRDRLAERERYLQETTDAAMSGWKKAEVDLAEMRTIATERSEACGKAGAERDRLAKQPAVSMDDLARAISSGDVQINHGDYPAWDDLAGSGRDAYRQLARHLLATFRILGALDGDDREEASDG